MSVNLLKNQIIAAQLAQQKEIHNDQMSLSLEKLKQKSNEHSEQQYTQREIARINTESDKYIAELNTKNSIDLKILEGQNSLSQTFYNSLGRMAEQNNTSVHSVAMKLLEFKLAEISADNELERKKEFETHKARLLQLVSKFEELPKNHPHYDEIQTRLEYELKKQLAIEVENHKHNLRMSEKNAISEDDVRKILQDRLSYRPDDDY